ncbi:hypothetical protein [Paraburkholderia sediminicola]|uniref:hypothetical protein n=1 Tax=Paraburkholderia sediminicola TaxID=458836 RepID=UPI0038B751A2
MPKLVSVFFEPPLAFGRLGGSGRPLENYQWCDDTTLHGAGRTVIEPATTLQVLPDGSLAVYRPSVLEFVDDGEFRPVAPFFELWATVEWSSDDPESKTHGPGTVSDVPLTETLLGRLGSGLDGVSYSIHLANRKAARRTGDDANAFEAQSRVAGHDFHRQTLYAFTVPKPGMAPLVTSERPIPLGAFQVIRPVARLSMDVELDVLRVRYTPARGEVYGPPSAVAAADGTTGRVFPIVPAENRVLNPAASWLRYDGSYARYGNSEPADTYDGADQNQGMSWGVVDDTCDGLITASVVVQSLRFTAVARVSVGPPDYAPDRRPFLSLADDLTDRDEDAPSVHDVRASRQEIEAAVGDLFERVFETASLVNLDVLRLRAINDNSSFIIPATATKPVKGVPLTDSGSMTSKDSPYSDDKVDALTPGTNADTVASSSDPLPYSDVVPLAHERLAQIDELIEFFTQRPDRAHRMLRPAYGSFADLKPAVSRTDTPDPSFRDARISRDQAHDMRMPPYMRDELGTALSLTRRQYLEVLRYIEALAPSGMHAREDALAHETTATAVASSLSPLRRRVNLVLARLRNVSTVHGGAL